MFFSSASASFPVISYLFVSLSHKISGNDNENGNMSNVIKMSMPITTQKKRYEISEMNESTTPNSTIVTHTICTLTSLTLILALADVSIKAQLNWLAKPFPKSFPTTRSSSKSHLLPTSTIGTSSVSWKKTMKISRVFFPPSIGKLFIDLVK